jgi:hypothetical protein
LDDTGPIVIDERDSQGFVWTLCRLASPRVVYEDPAHHLGRHAEKLRPILPPDARLVDQPQVGFVNERGRLQGVGGALASEVIRGLPSKFVVDERQERVPCLEVTIAPCQQQASQRGSLMVHAAVLHPRSEGMTQSAVVSRVVL